jgi:OOP family OmpA-OmpF porin
VIVRAVLAAVAVAGVCGACAGAHEVGEPAALPYPLPSYSGPIVTLSSPPSVVLPVAPSPRGGLIPVPAPPSLCLVKVSVPDKTLGFAFDSTVVSASGRAAVTSYVKEAVRENSGLRVTGVTVVGHTSIDAKGQEAYDQALSGRRAEAVAAALRSVSGLGPVTPSGVGEGDPLFPNDSAAHRQANRRSVVSIAFTGCQES